MVRPRFSVETIDALGDGTDELFHGLVRRIAAVTGERRATSEYLLQRLSVCIIAIQRGNAASVLGTVGGDSHYSNPDVLYYL